MKEQIRELVSEEQEIGPYARSIFASATLGGGVLVGAIYEPKLPPYSGD